MVRRLLTGTIAVALVVVATACTDSAEPASTTTVPPITTLSTTTTTTVPPSSTTTAPLTELTAPGYRIVERQPTDLPGDEVVVLLDPESYDSLTDLDLYDLIAEVVELFPPVSVVHVVDSPAAANLVANPDASQDDLGLVLANYLARLDDGFRVTYLGPFASSGTAVLGS